MKLNLDLDGVFADFDNGFRKRIGFDYWRDPKLAWSILDKVPHLFRDLEPLPEASLGFYKLVSQVGIRNSRILTALPILTNKLVTAKEDKNTWVKYYLDTDIEVVCTDGWSHKIDYCCNTSDILIDDSLRNIEHWKSAGGIGILHTSFKSSLEQLKEALDR